MTVGRKANGQLKKGYRLTKSGVRKAGKRHAKKRVRHHKRR